MRITVFGGAAPKPGEPAYEQAKFLGKLLGEQGYSVLTGGYCGTMEAVSRGAAEAGAHVIGVTCTEVEKWRKSGPNAWVKEEWHCKSLDERIDTLINNCDTAIGLPGGIGTLTEIMLYWNRLVINIITRPPIILIGLGWEQVLNCFIDSQKEYLHDEDVKFIKYAKDVQTAIILLQKEMKSQ